MFQTYFNFSHINKGESFPNCCMSTDGFSFVLPFSVKLWPDFLLPFLKCICTLKSLVKKPEGKNLSSIFFLL